MPVLLGEPEQPQIDISALESRSPRQQRHRMLLALVLLLIALTLVLVRYREFWLPPGSSSEAEVAPTAPAEPTAKSHTKAGKAHGGSLSATARHSAVAGDAESAAATAEVTRVVLHPMQVEVLRSGGRRQTIRTRPAGISIDLSKDVNDIPPPSQAAASAPAPAGDQVHMSPATVAAVTTPVDPVYPPLAEQMNVQGSVVLQLHVGKDGNIQDLQVVSGPDILAEAAREAVRQWHFKPYLRDGSAVDTEAQVTVKFSISTP
jgi:TonB family protein